MCTSGVMYEFEEEPIEDCRIQKDIEASLVEDLEGWGFDMDSLRESEGGRLLSRPKVATRIFDECLK